jgi:hypothetical protein
MVFPPEIIVSNLAAIENLPGQFPRYAGGSISPTF